MSLKSLRQIVAVGALGVLAAAGCRGDDQAEGPVGSTSGALVGSNGLFANGLFANGLFANGLALPEARAHFGAPTGVSW